MDWGHIALGGIVAAVVVLRLFTRRKRSLHVRIDWEEEGNDLG